MLEALVYSPNKSEFLTSSVMIKGVTMLSPVAVKSREGKPNRWASSRFYLILIIRNILRTCWNYKWNHNGHLGPLIQPQKHLTSQLKLKNPNNKHHFQFLFLASCACFHNKLSATYHNQLVIEFRFLFFFFFPI